jgi:fumarylacetoacetate (FAA) hydrolase family protein
MASLLPLDHESATLIGRADFGQGPTPIGLSGGRIMDLSGLAPTVADLINRLEPGETPRGPVIEGVSLAGLKPDWAGGKGWLLAPIDLHCIKAAGVTFAVSTLERVIEEAARGDRGHANEIRECFSATIGIDLHAVRPGSDRALRLKDELIAAGLWSQYLEVAIGRDAEIFTKAPVLSAVGWGALAGIRSDSVWNNPEPEIVLVCDGLGRARGAALGNDVNLRDFEGRSALLLGKAKDNNASCVIGPFIRLFDSAFGMDDVRRAVISLEVEGEDGFVLRGSSQMEKISRDPEDLIAQAYGVHHRYPDGFALFCGTMFAPTQDRGATGQGFTHQVGDIVRVSSPRLGQIENRMVHCENAPPWSLGIGELMRNLSRRGLLA